MTADLIYDVGFNNGDDTAFYLSQGHKVVAVDANPTLVEAGRQRFRREIEQGALTLLNVGISDGEGHAEFWVCDEKPQFSSFHRSSAARDGLKHHAIQVPTTRFENILGKYGIPRYLKIDIEGHERMCLEALTPATLPSYVSIECESPTDDAARSDREGVKLLSTIRDLGYSRFKLIHQFTFCSMSRPRSLNYLVDSVARRVLVESRARRLPGAATLARYLTIRPGLERKFHREFPQGSSGVWGEDTAGEWLSYAEAERAYDYYRDLHLAHPTEPRYWIWCDWHAKR